MHNLQQAEFTIDNTTGTVRPPRLTALLRREAARRASQEVLLSYHFFSVSFRSAIISTALAIADLMIHKNQDQVNLLVLIPALLTYLESIFQENYEHYSLMEDSQVLFYLFDTYRNNENQESSPGLYVNVGNLSNIVLGIGLLVVFTQIILVSIGENIPASIIGIIAPLLSSLINKAISIYHKTIFNELENVYRSGNAIFQQDYDKFKGIEHYKHLRRTRWEFLTNVGICNQIQIQGGNSPRKVLGVTNMNLPLRFYQDHRRDADSGDQIIRLATQ